MTADPNTRFLDLRMLWGGGEVAPAPQPMLWIGTPTIGDTNYVDHACYIDLALNDLQAYVRGRDVLFATHGFANNREDGIHELSEWRKLLTLPDSAAFVGVLWPGDSEYLGPLCYPGEPSQAMDAGAKLAAFVDAYLQGAASFSFASHSLGARVILNAMTNMQLPVRRAIIMAGAINDDCLTNEFSSIQQKAQEIVVMASQQDGVLRWAFPMGDLAAEILGKEHPWWESALGRFGPVTRPARYLPPCEIPDCWNFGHGDYLRSKPPAPAVIPPPPAPAMPDPNAPPPLGGAAGWQEAWSASVVSSFFR